MPPGAGAALADFPGGSGAELYDGLRGIVSLPEETRVFVGRDHATGRVAVCALQSRLCGVSSD